MWVRSWQASDLNLQAVISAALALTLIIPYYSQAQDVESLHFHADPLIYISDHPYVIWLNFCMEGTSGKVVFFTVTANKRQYEGSFQCMQKYKHF